MNRVLAVLLGLSLFLASCGGPSPEAAPAAAVAGAEQVAVSDGADASSESDLSALATTGLTGEYFDTLDFTGPKKTKVDLTVSKSWGTAAPVAGIAPTTYSVRWTGQIAAKYTETYTFFLTSSGGARLMVNGVALVNSFDDHALKTDTGTIALKAGVKYDIRIDYFRGTVNPGVLKLDWRSPSQARQAVPNESLSNGTTNTESAIGIVAKNPKFASTGDKLTAQSSYALVSNNGSILLFSLLENPTRVYLSGVSGGKVREIIRIQKNGTDIVLTDILNSNTAEINNLDNYFGSNGKIIDSKHSEISNTIADLLSSAYYGGKTQKTQGGISTQGIGSVILCKFIEPPPGCAGGVCDAKATSYRDAICTEVGLVEDIISLLKGNAVSFGQFVITVGTAGPDFFDVSLKEWRIRIVMHWDAWEEYKKCTADNTYKPTSNGTNGAAQGCIVGFKIDPQNIVIDAIVGTTGRFKANITNQSSDPDPALKANTLLDIKAQVSTSTPEYFGVYDGTTLTIAPDETRWLYIVGYVCPPTPQVISALILVQHNANRPISSPNVSVQVNCKNIPPVMSDPTPNPINLRGKIGEIPASFFTFQNLAPESTLNYTLSGSAGLKLGPVAGALAGGETASIAVAQECVTAGVQNGTVTVKSDDPAKPSVEVRVILSCESGTPINVDIKYATNYSFFPYVDSYPGLNGRPPLPAGGQISLSNFGTAGYSATWTADRGTIVASPDGSSAIFTAPLANPGKEVSDVTVTAVSKTDPSKSDTFVIAVTPITLDIQYETGYVFFPYVDSYPGLNGRPALPAGGQVSLKNLGTAGYPATWTTDRGTIAASQDGSSAVFTAPLANPGTGLSYATVTAISDVDPSKSDVFVVSIAPITVDIQYETGYVFFPYMDSYPGLTTRPGLSGGGQVKLYNFGTAGYPVAWSTNGGSILPSPDGSSAIFTAPLGSSGFIIVTATN
jgi:PA14 domain